MHVASLLSLPLLQILVGPKKRTLHLATLLRHKVLRLPLRTIEVLRPVRRLALLYLRLQRQGTDEAFEIALVLRINLPGHVEAPASCVDDLQFCGMCAGGSALRALKCVWLYSLRSRQ